MIETLILRVEAMRTVFWLYSVFPISWTFACVAEAVCLPIIWRREFRLMDERKAKNEKAHA